MAGEVLEEVQEEEAETSEGAILVAVAQAAVGN